MLSEKDHDLQRKLSCRKLLESVGLPGIDGLIQTPTDGEGIQVDTAKEKL